MGRPVIADTQQASPSLPLDVAEPPVSPTTSAGAAPGERTRSQNIPYLLGVDHLRGAAALLIVYYHGIQLFSSQTRYARMFSWEDWWTAPDPFSALVFEGHTAVALFLVLSGFIFAFGAADRRVAYGQFLTNRFLRTYPLLIFLILVGSAVQPNELEFFSLLQTLLAGANLRGAQAFGDFSAMFWSVAVEWQLYLLFPALMAILNRAGPRPLLLLIVMLWGARTLGFLEGMNPVDGLYTQLVGRLDQFVLGMLAGWVYARNRRHRLLRRMFAPSLLLVFVGAYVFNHFGGWPRQEWWKLVTPSAEGLLWSGVVLGYVALMDRPGYSPGWLARAAVAIGAMSYSIYLWHYLFIQIQRTRAWLPRLIDQHELNAALVVTLTTLPVTLLFAGLSYQVIEKPFMALRKRYVVAPEATAAQAFASR